MKVEQATLEVTRSSSFQERSFGIEANAKAFDILSSKIYTDIPLAIVRELSTNASDSHTDAGKASLPFDVHLPNTLEPFLAIRDHGTGLSPEDVETIYTTYFKSTRTGSDDFTGCLGLGSKSPFAYTDQFTIVANWNGKQYTYSAFKNETGRPSLALLNDCDTTEGNGLEIKINIKPGDADAFIAAAKRVYRHFNVRPNISGVSLYFDDLTPEISTADFHLYNGNPYTTGYQSKINVVMGQVCYAVDTQKVPSNLGKESTIVLFMEIGSCSIAASREEIHYDDKTIAAVAAKIDLASEKIKEELYQRFEIGTNALDKLRKMTTFMGLWDGLALRSGFNFIPVNAPGQYSMRELSMRVGRRSSKSKLTINEYCDNISGYDLGHEFVFIEEDVELTQNYKTRLRTLLANNKYNTDVYLVKIEDMASFEEAFGPVTTKLSLLPDVARAARMASPRARAKSIRLLVDDSWESPATIDATDACSVPRAGNHVLWNGSRMTAADIGAIAKALGFTKVYGISEKRYERSCQKHGLTDLASVAKDRTEAIINNLDGYALAKYQSSSRHISYWFEGKIKETQGLSTECDDVIKMLEANTHNMTMYQRLCNVFNLTLPTATDYMGAFFKKYPILVAVEWGNVKMDVLKDYITMMENV